MAGKKLEFRGISLSYLSMYLKELGGEQHTHSFPFLFKGSGWSAEILKEETITFTPSFKVNAVHMHFYADSDEILEQVIKRYRYKTTRAGG